MINCIAFDFDGTLVDSNRIKHETFFDVVDGIKGGADVMNDVLLENPGDRFEIFRRFLELLPNTFTSQTPAQPENSVTALAAEYTARSEDAVTACQEVPGAERLLAQLRQQGIITAVISATPTSALSAIVARRGWNEAFCHVFGRPNDKFENLSRLSTTTSLIPDEIMMVGDKQEDLQAANDFGCHFVAVISSDNDFVTSPSYAITSLGQLVELMDQINEAEA